MSDASSLCTRCGLCCDCTLFDQAKAQPSETSRMQANGLTVISKDGKNRFALPCSLLRDCSCSAYETRFEICRSFRCELLKKLDAGAIELEQAVEIVATAKQLRNEVLKDLPNADPKTGFRKLLMQNALWNDLPSSEQLSRAKVALKLAVCRRYLAKHFIRPDKVERWGW